MNKESILKAIQEVKKTGKKRKFTQSLDLIINLKLDLKRAGSVTAAAVLPHPKSKKPNICAFVDNELAKQAKEVFHKTVLKSDFRKIDKKALKKLTQECKYFVAQANVMTDIAKFFGKILGPKGMMPDPKIGCVIPPNANLKAVNERLQKTVKLDIKKELNVKCSVGLETDDENKICENVEAVYNALLHALPREKQDIKNVMLKLTMSKPVEIK